MPGPVFIEGDSVELCTAEREDLEFLQQGMNHPGVRRYAGGDVPYNRQRYEDERFDVILDDDVFHALVRAEGQRVGDVLLAPIDERRGWANLGYWVHPDHWGKGYATEAASLAVTHGFEELALHRVSATIVADNEASKRVVEKLGFVHEGTKRDDAFVGGEYVDREVYAVLVDEWGA
jgi:RimJ/RimL family protein N-acetyltransferase